MHRNRRALFRPEGREVYYTGSGTLYTTESRGSRMIALPPRFWRDFLIASALLLAGIMLAIVQAFLASPHVIPLDPAGLAARAGYHRDTVMPFLAAAFPRLLFLNAGVALFILIV